MAKTFKEYMDIYRNATTYPASERALRKVLSAANVEIAPEIPPEPGGAICVSFPGNPKSSIWEKLPEGIWVSYGFVYKSWEELFTQAESIDSMAVAKVIK